MSTLNVFMINLGNWWPGVCDFSTPDSLNAQLNIPLPDSPKVLDVVLFPPHRVLNPRDTSDDHWGR